MMDIRAGVIICSALPVDRAPRIKKKHANFDPRGGMMPNEPSLDKLLAALVDGLDEGALLEALLGAAPTEEDLLALLGGIEAPEAETHFPLVVDVLGKVE